VKRYLGKGKKEKVAVIEITHPDAGKIENKNWVRSLTFKNLTKPN
jgi:hypothetical protein